MRSWSILARRGYTTTAIVLLACLVVLGLFVHISRRSDVLDDVLAEPPAREAAVTPLVKATTTLPLSQTTVRRAGYVALRLSVRGGRPLESSIALRILGAGGQELARCVYPRGTLADSSVMRCPVGNLALVHRARLTVAPPPRGLSVVGNTAGFGKLLVPRSRTLVGRLRTVLGRIGARHPAPFSGWIVPIGTILWLSALASVALTVVRPARRPMADETRDGEGS
jgi:hypothetical protein